MMQKTDSASWGERWVSCHPQFPSLALQKALSVPVGSYFITSNSDEPAIQ